MSTFDDNYSQVICIINELVYLGVDHAGIIIMLIVDLRVVFNKNNSLSNSELSLSFLFSLSFYSAPTDVGVLLTDVGTLRIDVGVLTAGPQKNVGDHRLPTQL